MSRYTVKSFRMEYKKRGRAFDINLEIDNRRFQKQYSRAQYRLDSIVMTHMIPFMPKETNTFINVTRGMSAAIAGTGQVYAAAPPFGRFLYHGKVMVDPQTGSPWARRGAKKVVTGRELSYTKSKHPDAQAYWFDAAKRAHGANWVALAKKYAGGG